MRQLKVRLEPFAAATYTFRSSSIIVPALALCTGLGRVHAALVNNMQLHLKGFAHVQKLCAIKNIAKWALFSNLLTIL